MAASEPPHSGDCRLDVTSTTDLKGCAGPQIIDASRTGPGQSSTTLADDGLATPAHTRGMKRKRASGPDALVDVAASCKRSSPPWKDFNPANPTAFKQDGKRKSGRVNPVPLDLQPQGVTRGKRRTHVRDRKDEAKSEPVGNDTQKKEGSRGRARLAHLRKSPQASSRALSQPPVLPVVTSLAVPFPGQDRTRRRNSTKRRSHQAFPVIAAPLRAVDQPPANPAKSLRLRFNRPLPTVLNKWNLSSPRQYGSIRECFDNICQAGEDQIKPLSELEARQEALLWKRLELAAAPGGVLNADADLALPGQQAAAVNRTVGLPQSFAHPDFLCTHVTMFARALREEHRDHRRKAKELAYHALELWKSKQPKSDAQLVAESRQTYRSLLCKEIRDKWILVKTIVTRQKLDEHEQRRKELVDEDIKGALDELLRDQNDAMQRRKGRTIGQDDAEDDSDSDAASAIDSNRESYDATDDDSANSDNDESDEPDDAGEDAFGDLLGDELRKRIYGETAVEDLALSIGDDADRTESQTPKDHSNFSKGISSNGAIPLEEVAEELLDSDSEGSDEDDDPDDDSESDDSHDSDDDNDESERNEHDDNGADSAEVSGDERHDGLLGFFSGRTKQVLQEATLKQRAVAEEKIRRDFPGLTDSAPQTARACDSPLRFDHATIDAGSTSDGPSEGDTPATTLSKHSETDQAKEVDQTQSNKSATEQSEAHEKVSLTPVSALLRGRLRIYQHQGLDWLAGLYSNRENGILADEMGLGKTIQTISLLAHLATERGIWGPHLIVVPTSVLLNWEIEFKKFLPAFKVLTYYGTQEERKAKRKGWMDDDRWNVCITSYQMVLQDASALKRRNWHYMVLDEAHNIKNFKSQRWQTMLSFKTHSRLLLTGTPLQNNLIELWSLLFFLEPGLDEEGNTKFKDLRTFAHMFNKPAEQILDHGREGMDDASREVVKKLQVVLRPHLLRRLKADVEKQMPRKFEHVVRCRLSKRQRELYDGYMGLSGTKESFASGNYMSIIGSLMQLRKVCNHPDLFETRQIVTSYAMPEAVTADYEIKELLLRRRLISFEEETCGKLDMLRLWRPNTGTIINKRSRRLAALQPLAFASRSLEGRLDTDLIPISTTFASSNDVVVQRMQSDRLRELHMHHDQTAYRTQGAPAYGAGLLQRYTFEKSPHIVNSQPKRRNRLTDWCLSTSSVLQDFFGLNLPFSPHTSTLVEKFGCITPVVVVPGVARQVLAPSAVEAAHDEQLVRAPDLYHRAQTRLSIAFPDKNLIQYDCGKLQELDKLLRRLQSGGHRVLIFTQMVKVLDVLEQFLNIHGHRYLRLDGSTKVEARQALTDQFNQDTRILAFILSSRSGGLGINLTGADTVVFYDLDWNPAMDKQCQDRCHRIGQTRDVHIYRFVSEGTIEANILRKSNQKRMLDDVVIQEGGFTTEAFYQVEHMDNISAEADAALDRVLGGSGIGRVRGGGMLGQVEDQEDWDAARQAEKENVRTDDVDFVDARYEGPRATVSAPGHGSEAVIDDSQLVEDEEEEPGSYEDYMLRFMHYELRDAAMVVSELGPSRRKTKSKQGKADGIRRTRRT